MPYTPTDWVDNTTPLSAANLNNLETQYSDAMTDGGIPYAVDTSATADTITATVSPAPTAYADGYSVRVKVANTTTGATTLNVNGLGAVAVNNADGTAVGAGDLVAGVPRIFTYVTAGTPFFVASGSGGLSASGNATPADVLPTATFTSQGGRDQTGGMATVAGGNTVVPTMANQTAIAATTYAENAITVAGDPNLTPANIVSGVSIFGVAGTFQDVATGTTNANTTTTSYGTYGNTYTVAVSGLAFTPSVISIQPTSGAAPTLVFYNAKTANAFNLILANNAGGADGTSLSSMSPASVANNAFSLPYPGASGEQVNWVAVR